LSGGESDYEQGNYTVYLLILKRNSRDESFIAAPQNFLSFCFYEWT
jgi:hypothetical protein